MTTARKRTPKHAEKAERIAAILDSLYPAPAIPLRHSDPFQLLVAVILSAQTTDAQVNRITPALFDRAPDAGTMASLTASEIQDLIRSCGLAPAKAKNLSAMSKILVNHYAGRVPETIEELEELPGVGHKTASVVMTQAFGKPAFPVDTHIHRLAERWGLSNGHSVVRTEADLKASFPDESWGKVHLQMIYFGREHCPALRHDAAECPICSWARTRTQRKAAAATTTRRPSAAARSGRGRRSR